VISFLQALNRISFIAIHLVFALYRKIVLIVVDVLRIDGIEIAFAKRQVINGIKQVSFTGGIVPYKTIHFWRKREFGYFVILEIMKV
jgi:hypothetical protein